MLARRAPPAAAALRHRPPDSHGSAGSVAVGGLEALRLGDAAGRALLGKAAVHRIDVLAQAHLLGGLPAAAVGLVAELERAPVLHGDLVEVHELGDGVSRLLAGLERNTWGEAGTAQHVREGVEMKE